MRILLTGASGNLGSLILSKLSTKYEWVLADFKIPLFTYGHPFFQVNLSEFNTLYSLCSKVEMVIHLAACASPEAKWDDLIEPNIKGVYNVLEAAYQSKCQRVIFASSIHVVDGYPREMQLYPSMPPNPLSLYGATKAWGEALAAYYAYQKNLPVICLRLGWVKAHNDLTLFPNNPHLNIILTDRDFVRLIVASIETPFTQKFGIYHGISNNQFKRLDITSTREVLGYQPQDDAFAIAKQNNRNPIRLWINVLKKVFGSMTKHFSK